MPERHEPGECRPRLPVTQPCATFFKEIRSLFSFFVFMLRITDRVDNTGKAAARELLRLSSVVDSLVSEDDKQAAERVAREGTGIAEVLEGYGRFIGELMLCRGVDAYLNYISELLALIFRTRPETMKSGEMVRIDSVLEHTSMQDLIAALAARKVHDLSYQGMENLASYLDSKMGFNLFGDASGLRNAVSVVEARNLIVHNRGIVNEVFVSRVHDHGTKLGDRLRISPVKDIGFLERAVYEADARAAAKFRLPQPITKLEFHDKILGNICIS